MSTTSFTRSVEADVAAHRWDVWGLVLPAIFLGASIVFAVWSVLDARDTLRAEREHLEQRLTTIERTVAELQNERRP